MLTDGQVGHLIVKGNVFDWVGIPGELKSDDFAPGEPIHKGTMELAYPTNDGEMNVLYTFVDHNGKRSAWMTWHLSDLVTAIKYEWLKPTGFRRDENGEVVAIPNVKETVPMMGFHQQRNVTDL